MLMAVGRNRAGAWLSADFDRLGQGIERRCPRKIFVAVVCLRVGTT